MKDKNLPNDYNSLTLEELTKEANKMIEDLESQKDLENSLESYQNLLKLNNIIENSIKKHPHEYLWQHRRFKSTLGKEFYK